MLKQLRALTVLLEGLGSIPITHMAKYYLEFQFQGTQHPLSTICGYQALSCYTDIHRSKILTNIKYICIYTHVYMSICIYIYISHIVCLFNRAHTCTSVVWHMIRVPSTITALCLQNFFDSIPVKGHFPSTSTPWSHLNFLLSCQFYVLLSKQNDMNLTQHGGACLNPSTWEVNTGGPGVQSCSQLYS